MLKKRHVPDQPTHGYLTKAVRSCYSNLSNAKSDSQEINKACKLAKRCYEKLERGDFEDGTSSKKFRSSGGGRKSRAPEVRDALFCNALSLMFYLCSVFRITLVILLRV